MNKVDLCTDGTMRMVLASDQELNIPARTIENDIGVTILHDIEVTMTDVGVTVLNESTVSLDATQLLSLQQNNLGVFTTDSGLKQFFMQSFHSDVQTTQHGLANGFAGGETFFFPTVDFQTFSLVSSSEFDVNGGSGANTVIVIYEDSNGDTGINLVTMNGTKPVLVDVGSAIVFNIIAVNVITAGEHDANEGVIKITHESSTTNILNIIGIDDSRSIECKEYIPLGHTLYLRKLNGFAASLAADDLAIFTYAKIANSNVIYSLGQILVNGNSQVNLSQDWTGGRLSASLLNPFATIGLFVWFEVQKLSSGGDVRINIVLTGHTREE